MPKISYINSELNASSLAIVNDTIKIIDEYEALNIFPTLRGLYYRMIARDLFPEYWRDKKTKSKNNPNNYKKFSYLITKARLTGLIDWDSISDHTRSKKGITHWGNPDHIIKAVPGSFHLDHWAGQKIRPEVWIEKDALTGVISSICKKLDVDYFACVGYVSQSEMWTAAQRLTDYMFDKQKPVIIYLGDHDPSGLDMSRDIRDRLKMFMDRRCHVNRIALNIDQVRKYNPPPDPAKFPDPRFVEYKSMYGTDSWELDALDPLVIQKLIEKTVLEYRNDKIYHKVMEQEYKDLAKLCIVAKNWRSLIK
jgi:hypothetical protein